MIDPSGRWRRVHGPEMEQAAWAGLPSFAGVKYTEEPAELAGFDAAIVGAPFDELVSDRPGTRFGPRAIRAASPTGGFHLEQGIDWMSELEVVDYGDAPIVPADPGASLKAIGDTVAEVVAAGVFPLVLGGDHSITEPDVHACAAARAPIGLLHFDAHTDTADQLHLQRRSHGTPMRRLIEDGLVDPERYVQIGLRGWWPEEEVMDWQREQGITTFFMHDVERLGIAEVMAGALETLGDDPAFLTVDVDALDPAFAPGTGTPEPGGMTAGQLLGACRTAARELQLIGADVVEVLPLAVEDRTAVVANRIVAEILTGLAARRRSSGT
jgi:agmatinase